MELPYNGGDNASSRHLILPNKVIIKKVKYC